MITTTDRSALRPTRADAEAGWVALIRAASEQHRRLAEESPYGTEAFRVSRLPAFRPGASPSEELAFLTSLARPDDVWMDVGAGAGRLAIPLAGVVRRLVAVDPSPTMREALQAAAADARLDNVEIHDRRWPGDADLLPEVDVAMAANLMYGVEEPLAWVDAMERRARRLCVATLADRHARAPNEDVWRELMGEPLVHAPGATDFVALLLATGRRLDVNTFVAPGPKGAAVADAVEAQRWRCGIGADSPRLDRLRQIVEARADADGLVRLPTGRRYTAVVTWEPPPRRA